MSQEYWHCLQFYFFNRPLRKRIASLGNCGGMSWEKCMKISSVVKKRKRSPDLQGLVWGGLNINLFLARPWRPSNSGFKWVVHGPALCKGQVCLAATVCNKHDLFGGLACTVHFVCLCQRVIAIFLKRDSLNLLATDLLRYPAVCLESDQAAFSAD